jgi:PAS domain S-box-containing protein
MKSHDEHNRIQAGRIAELEAENLRLKQMRPTETESLRTLFDAMPDFVAFKDTKSVYRMVNPAGCRLLGKKESGIVGKTDRNLFSEKEAELIHTLDDTVTGTLKPASGTLEITLASGSATLYVLNAPVLDQEGNLSGILCTMRDITAKTEAERLIHIWSDAFEHCAHGIAIGQASKKCILTCNLAFARMHNMSVEEIMGYDILELYPAEEHPHVLNNIRKLNASGYARFESRRIRKGDRLFPVQMEISCIYDRDGNPAYHIASVQDITERKLAELALKESEARFRAVVESAPEAIFVQTDGRYAYLNPAALALYGAEDAYEMLGRPVLEHIHPDFRKLVADEIQSINEQQNHPEPAEHIHLRCDGSPVELEILAVPFFYECRHGALVFARDSTSRKKAEAERLMLEKELFQSQKRESMGRFAGVVAHDLNNLLTPILGYADMIEKHIPAGRESGQQLHHIGMIRKAGLNAKSLVQQLLAFSRSQAIEFDSIDLNNVVSDFQDLLRRTVRENIEIRYRLFPGRLGINGNQGQLQQIIMNLAMNAQDAMPEGGTLVIETALTRKEGNSHDMPSESCSELVISDTGKGIDADTLPSIFEPFFTTKPKGLGTGLGLSTVYGIVRQHDATINVQSNPDKGTKFRISFPFVNADPEKQVPNEVTEYGNNAHASILVVEDNEMVRKFVVLALEHEGYAVTTASSGEEALSIVDNSSRPPELLLSDIIMEGMNGLELYDKIRMRYPDLKVLFMSGYSPDVFNSQGTFNQDAALLQKPFSIQALYEKVRETLSM